MFRLKITLLTISIAGLIASSALLSSTTLVQAATGDSCNPERTSNYMPLGKSAFDGWQIQPTNGVTALGGATVTANTYIPYVNDNDAVWSMLTQSNASATGFLQVGYYYNPSLYETPMFFVEWENSTGQLYSPIEVYPYGETPTLSEPEPGTTYSYNTLYNPAEQEYTLTIGITQNGITTNYPAYALTNDEYGYGFEQNEPVVFGSGPPWRVDLGFEPYGVEIYGEAHSTLDQMVGDLVNPEQLSQSGYYENGSWQTMSGATVNDNYPNTSGQWINNAEWGYNQVSSNDLAIWDNGCPMLYTSNPPSTQVADPITSGSYIDDQSGSSPFNTNTLFDQGPTGDSNGPYQLQDQGGTGNLMLVNNAGYVLWSPGIVTGSPTYATMQGSDCNFVDYDAWGNSAYFSTGAQSSASGCEINTQVDGNLVVYDNGSAVWSTGTNWDSSEVNGYPSALLYGQSMIEGTSSSQLWSPNGDYFLNMQSDGNLVLYYHNGSTNTPEWYSGLGGYYGECVEMQNSGSYAGALVLYPSYSGSTCTGTPVWESQGSGSGTYNHALVTSGGTLSIQEVTQTNGNYVTSLG